MINRPLNTKYDVLENITMHLVDFANSQKYDPELVALVLNLHNTDMAIDYDPDVRRAWPNCVSIYYYRCATRSRVLKANQAFLAVYNWREYQIRLGLSDVWEECNRLCDFYYNLALARF